MVSLDWTEERAEQLKLFIELLQTAIVLDKGSNFIDKAKSCIEISEILLLGNRGDLQLSFPEFLRRICIKDRESRLQNNQP